MILKVKRVLFFLLLIGFCFFEKEPCFSASPLGEGDGAKSSSIPVQNPVAPESTLDQKQESSTIIAFYFHGNFRCVNCRKIEQYSREAVEKYFAEQLKTGKVQFKPVNIDLPENKHFIKDYQLYTRSLIIAEFRGGKEKRWKNLTGVWNYLGDQEKFYDYVRTEIQAYLGSS